MSDSLLDDDTVTTLFTDQFDPGWKSVLDAMFEHEDLVSLDRFLQQQIALGKNVLPQREKWFNAFHFTAFDAVKVVILGQDPYPTPGHAHGLCFSVEEGVSPLPRSLNNIFKELKADLGIERLRGHLSDWAEQGVLLMNTVLTVEAGEAGSHRRKGWEQLTDLAVKALDDSEQPRVFILWGADARKKGQLLNRERHLVLESPHPSPLSARRGFFGSRPFSRTNDFLRENGAQAINW